jgi:hypothetical protein
MNVFLDDLNQAYTTGQLPTNNETDVRYLDCKYKYISYFSFISHPHLTFRCDHGATIANDWCKYVLA